MVLVQKLSQEITNWVPLGCEEESYTAQALCEIKPKDLDHQKHIYGHYAVIVFPQMKIHKLFFKKVRKIIQNFE